MAERAQELTIKSKRGTIHMPKSLRPNRGYIALMIVGAKSGEGTLGHARRNLLKMQTMHEAVMSIWFKYCHGQRHFERVARSGLGVVVCCRIILWIACGNSGHMATLVKPQPTSFFHNTVS
jgi:hypothetical protein